MSLEIREYTPPGIDTRKALTTSLAAILSAGVIGSAQADTGMEAYLKALQDEADGKTIVLAQADTGRPHLDTDQEGLPLYNNTDSIYGRDKRGKVCLLRKKGCSDPTLEGVLIAPDEAPMEGEMGNDDGDKEDYTINENGDMVF